MLFLLRNRMYFTTLIWA